MGRTQLLGIDLAGFRVAVERPPSCPWHWPDSGAPHPETSAAEPDIYVGVRVVRVGRCDARIPDAVRYALRGPGVGARAVEVGRQGDDWLVAVRGPAGCERVARFDRTLRAGEVILSPEVAASGAFPLAYPLDEVMLLQRLAREDGLVVEGNALVHDGAATVVLGNQPPMSPAVRWQELASCLRGRRVVLRIEDDTVRVHGVADARGRLEPVSARLAALHIARSGSIAAERPQPEDAVDDLLSHAITPAHDAGAAEQSLDVAARISQRVRLVTVEMPEARPQLPLAWGQPRTALGFAPPLG